VAIESGISRGPDKSAVQLLPAGERSATAGL